MIGDELRESVLQWAKLQKEPFVTAEVFNNIEEAESLKEASDSLRKLFISGHLARKKIDNVRYAYIVSEIAPLDFEKCFPAADNSSGDSVQVFDKKQQKIHAVKDAEKQKSKSVKKSVNPIVQEKNAFHELMEGAGLSNLLVEKGSAESATTASTVSASDTQETTLQSIKPLEMR